MIKNNEYKPYHLNASADDLAGNNGIGRYILLPGSDGRAKEISKQFDQLTIKSHDRGHNLYLGTIVHKKKPIAVAAVSSGMGCPSMEIILHELFHLGGKRFLRLGTAGSLQPNLVKLGDLVNAQAAVRDEDTTDDYVPAGFPANASPECITAILEAAKLLGLAGYLHTGLVHCKSSFYAREFGEGPKNQINKNYINLLTKCGVLASEMETSALFILSQLYNYQLMQKGNGPAFRVLCGAILSIVADPAHSTDPFATAAQSAKTITNMTNLSLETIRLLAEMDENNLSTL